MTTLILQRQLSNGNWIDCAAHGDTDARWLALCVAHNQGIASVEDAIAALLAGRTLRNDAEDWYSNCRAKPVTTAADTIAQAMSSNNSWQRRHDRDCD